MSDRLLRIGEVAARLHVSDRQVRRLLADAVDPLPCHRFGRRCVRVDPTELAVWIHRQHATGPAPSPGLFAGFSDDARKALEQLFCTHTAPNAAKIVAAQELTP